MNNLSKESLTLLEEAATLMWRIYRNRFEEYEKDKLSLEDTKPTDYNYLIEAHRDACARMQRNILTWDTALYRIIDSWEVAVITDCQDLRDLYHAFRPLLSDMLIRLGNEAKSKEWSEIINKLITAENEIRALLTKTNNE